MPTKSDAGKESGSVTDARSCPGSNSTRPSPCSTTYTLIGRGLVHLRVVSSHQKAGPPVDRTCCGRICTVAVLTTDTARIGPPAPAMSDPFLRQRGHRHTGDLRE